jgi:hypothetical protein
MIRRRKRLDRFGVKPAGLQDFGGGLWMGPDERRSIYQRRSGVRGVPLRVLSTDGAVSDRAQHPVGAWNAHPSAGGVPDRGRLRKRHSLRSWKSGGASVPRRVPST